MQATDVKTRGVPDVRIAQAGPVLLLGHHIAMEAESDAVVLAEAICGIQSCLIVASSKHVDASSDVSNRLHNVFIFVHEGEGLSDLTTMRISRRDSNLAILRPNCPRAIISASAGIV
jgi:hypothetical protein